MSLIDWIEETESRYRNKSAREATRESIYQLYIGALRRIGLVYNTGTPIWERDWDTLILLDACRFDLMKEVYPEGNIESFTSLGSTSEEWMAKNFTKQWSTEMSQTSYVTGNLFSQRQDKRKFRHFDEVWRDHWDSELGTIHPEHLTNRAIWADNNVDHDRMIVHYMQPHHPFVKDPVGEGMLELGESQIDVWDHLRKGNISSGDVWRRYRENLEYVLNEAENLIDHLDGKVVISSDHGNMMGEWGIYGHPGYIPFSGVKKVPWIECQGSGNKTSGEAPPDKEVKADIESRLEDLGYK